MRILVSGCAVAGLVAFLPQTEAKPPVCLPPLPAVFRALPHYEVGMASWYGSEHQGQPTASGEPFDMLGLTAAHRTLPLGTRVRVTNLSNRKSILLKVNDRGPGVRSRVIDVSWSAAKALGFADAGVALVSVEALTPHPARFPRAADSLSASVPPN